MRSKVKHRGMPRRVVMIYLLFCTIAVAWLAVGIVVTVQTVLSSRAVSSSLSQLGKSAAAIQVDYVRHGTENFQALVERFRTESNLTHCAIVSTDGNYLAHTSRDMLGQRALEPTGERLSRGELDGVRYVDARGSMLREYRTHLAAQDEPIGSLRIAVAEPSLSSTLLAVGEVAPISVLAPLAFLGIGAVVVGKITRPVERIESQLRRAATAAPGTMLDLEAIAARDAMSLGWNRVVESLQSRSEAGDLDEHLRQALQIRNQAKSDGVLDSIPDGIAVTDNEGQISFTNRAFPSLLGLRVDADELRGASIESQLVGDRESNGAAGLFEGATDRAAVATIERESAKGNRMLRIARLPLRSAGAAEDGKSVWTVRDVTQQKAADAMRDQFIDTVTHELRTPLANIKAYAETLAVTDVLDIESQKEFCNTINSEATRLARFVDDLLCISSIESGSLTSNEQNVETGRLLEEVVKKVKPLAQNKSITFDVSLGEKLPEMRLDKDKIDATLVNLLGNAIKYTPEGGRVGLRAKVNDSALQIDIEDTGVGISEEELPKIFDKFFRGSDLRVQQETGSGLGLSLASEVIRLHRGELTVESKVDKGSTFTVTLPLA